MSIANEECIRIEKDGKFFVSGKLAKTDLEVYEGFKEWLTKGFSSNKMYSREEMSKSFLEGAIFSSSQIPVDNTEAMDYFSEWIKENLK